MSDALRGQWPLAVAVMVACIGAGLIWAATIPVRHVAHAQAIAGATSVNAAAVPSFAEAGRSLAETYSRVFASDSVQRALQEVLTADTRGAENVEVVASPIPGSSVVLIEARASTRDLAERSADAGVDALVSSVSSLLASESAVAAASSDLDAAYRELAAMAANVAAAETSGSDADVALARARERTAQAKVAAYEALLQDLIRNSQQANGLQPLVSAQVVASNESQRFQMGIAIGAVVGALLGTVTALMVAHRRLNRPVR